MFVKSDRIFASAFARDGVFSTTFVNINFKIINLGT